MTNLINSINKLKNFGSFRNFSKDNSLDNSLPEFRRVNLFYGCNASGKTTLTRVFSYLNNASSVTPEFEKCELEISVNGKVIKNFNEYPVKNKIRIFNSDFIEDNLQLKEGQAKRLSVVIGKEDIDIKNNITKLEEELNALKNDKGELKALQELLGTKKKWDDLCKKTAIEAKSDLNLQQNDYKKDHFERNYEEYKSLSPSPNKITDDEKDEAVSILKSEAKQKIGRKYIENLQNIEAICSADFFNNFIELLKTPIKRKTAELKEKVIKWIEEGSGIHQEDHSKCQFCGQKISDSHWNTRANEIKEIIKKDDDLLKLEKEFTNNKNKIDNFHNILLMFHCDLELNDFITVKLFEEYEENRQAFDMSFKDFKEYFEILREKVEEKHNNKDTGFIFDNADNLIKAIEKLKQTIIDTIRSIEKNNHYVDQNDSLKEERKKKVIYYCIQTHYEELTKLEDDINFQTINERKVKQKVQEIEKEIKFKKTLLSNQKQIIEKINTLLKKILDSKLVFKFENDSYFLEREIKEQPNKPAKNLSDGEKSLIAFLYFIVSLESSSENEKKNEIIVIDDPVSSFDSHNLFNIQALLTQSVKDYGQSFFLTHNFYFFAKIRDALKVIFKQSENKKNAGDLKIFEIENRKDSGSILKDANKYIRKHISEYMNLIEKLKDIYDRSGNEKDVSTGKLIRRVLEVKRSFKAPNQENLYAKLQSIAGNDNQYQG